MLRHPTLGMQALAPPRSAAPVGPFQKPPLAPPRVIVPSGPYGMLMSAPRAVMFPMPEHAEPSALKHGGGGGGSALATGAATAKDAAAPANSTGISRAIFAIMILVYHENDERDSNV